MSACSLNIFILFILHPSQGFEVIQPQNRTVNSDGLASISCEHTANVTSVEDVQLNSISLTDKSKHKRQLLCQKGMEGCKNIIMHQENPNKVLFIILNIGPEAMNMKYECEFTVKKDDLDYTKKGIPTILLPEKEVVWVHHPPSPAQSHQLRWILIGLLALLFLYSCVITSFYIRVRLSNRDPENSTYVVMRKAPLPRNPAFNSY